MELHIIDEYLYSEFENSEIVRLKILEQISESILKKSIKLDYFIERSADSDIVFSLVCYTEKCIVLHCHGIIS